MLAKVDLEIIGDVVDELKNKIGCFNKQCDWTVTIYWHGNVATISQDKNGLREYEIKQGLTTITIDGGAPAMTTLGNDFSVTVKGDFTEEGGALSPTLGLFVTMIAVLATMRCLLDVYAPIKESVREALKGLLLQMLHSGSPAYPYGLKIYCFVCETIFGLVDYTDEDEDYVKRSVTENNLRVLGNIAAQMKEAEKEEGT